MRALLKLQSLKSVAIDLVIDKLFDKLTIILKVIISKWTLKIFLIIIIRINFKDSICRYLAENKKGISTRIYDRRNWMWKINFMTSINFKNWSIILEGIYKSISFILINSIHRIAIINCLLFFVQIICELSINIPKLSKKGPTWNLKLILINDFPIEAFDVLIQSIEDFQSKLILSNRPKKIKSDIINQFLFELSFRNLAKFKFWIGIIFGDTRLTVSSALFRLSMLLYLLFAYNDFEGRFGR